jgi:hypothetical protein
VVELAADGTEAGVYVPKTLAVGQLSECHRQILIPTGQSVQIATTTISVYAVMELLVGKELDQLREDGAPCVHPALSRFPTRLPRTLRSVIFISNRFNVKSHAFHWIYTACTVPPEVSPDSSEDLHLSEKRRLIGRKSEQQQWVPPLVVNLAHYSHPGLPRF